MPKLLNINNYHYRRGGAETVYLDHGQIFKDAGWAIDWFSMKHPRTMPGTDDSLFADLIDLEYTHGPADKLRAARDIIYNRSAAQRIGQMVDRWRPDIAHVHNIYHHLSPSVLVALKQRGIPVVLTAHDLKLACPAYTMLNDKGICESCRGGKVWNVARNRCIKGSLVSSTLIMVESAVHKALGLYERNVDAIVTPSAFYREKLIEWGWAADRIVHIRNFSDLPPLAPFTPGEDLLYFGRLAPNKGLVTLIKAAAEARVPMRLVGTGEQEGELRALAEKLEAPVTFVGYLTGDALWDAVAQARAVVLPSEWYENGPMSTIEAFARGKPLVGAAIGGIPELIEEGRTGWSFRSGDVADLARALKQAMEAPPALLAEMAQATRQMAEEKFSAQSYFTEMQALYARLGVK